MARKKGVTRDKHRGTLVRLLARLSPFYRPGRDYLAALDVNLHFLGLVRLPLPAESRLAGGTDTARDATPAINGIDEI